MNVIDMVAEYMRAHQYDGLCLPEQDCACLREDIAPCAAISGRCRPGHRVNVSADTPCGCDESGTDHWHIVAADGASGSGESGADAFGPLRRTAGNVHEDGTAAIGDDPALSLARQFHDTYERLAPSYGYKTRPETKVFNPDTPNGRLMQTCREIMHRVVEMADTLRPQSPASGQAEHGGDRAGSSPAPVPNTEAQRPAVAGTLPPLVGGSGLEVSHV